ncbi:hypothetical protein LAPL110952_02785 [Lactiplantibacillus plajomi]
MTKLLPVAVTAIGERMPQTAAYMTFVVNGQKFSTARKHTPFILKALSAGAAAHGRVTISTNQLQLADEAGRVFQSFALFSGAIVSLDLGLWHSQRREFGPRGHHAAWRYTLEITLVTSSGSFRCLNTDLTLLPALLAWARAYRITVNDPLALALRARGLPRLTEAQFDQLTRGTPYNARCQTIGAQ